MKKVIFPLIVIIMVTACAPVSGVDPSTAPPSATALPPALSPEPTRENAKTPATLPGEEPLVVAFAKDGDLHLWDSESGQSRTLLRAGDITTVLMSGDGRVIAFLRRTLVEQPELAEYVSLWAVDRSGENPRELVSADSLRARLNPEARDSVAIAQFGWIPGTHRLVYNASKHYLPGQGFTLSTDLYAVDADTGTHAVLAAGIMPDTAFINAWRFVLSPDGRQIALISGTALSFVNSDGSNRREAVLTYPQVGAGDAVLLPSGVWTQDSNAFVFTGPMQSESIHILNYTIWLVPADGSPAQPLDKLTDSHSSSVTFSPDGTRMAFFQDRNADGTIQVSDYPIMTLAAPIGPLALPQGLELFYANLHWSPGGAAFVIDGRQLFPLCPDAASSSEVCGDAIALEGDGQIVNSIHWIDAERFLFTSVEPSTLSLGHVDGTITPVVAWADHDPLAGWSAYLVH